MGGGAQKLGEFSDVDVSHAVPRQLHTLAFTGSKWLAFATGREHKVRKVTNAGKGLDTPRDFTIYKKDNFCIF